VPALVDSKQQRSERGADVEPRRDGHTDGEGARNRPQYEAGCNGQHVDQYDALERVGVREGYCPIADQNSREAPPERYAGLDPGRDRDDRGRPRRLR
jgi:hypothetical protein